MQAVTDCINHWSYIHNMTDCIKRYQTLTEMCVLLSGLEDVDHLLVPCPFAKEFLFRFIQARGLTALLPDSEHKVVDW